MNAMFFLMIWIGGAAIHTCLELWLKKRAERYGRRPVTRLQNQKDQL